MLAPMVFPIFGNTQSKSVKFSLNENTFPTCNPIIYGKYAPVSQELDNDKKKIIEKLDEFEKLKDGWDGYCAKAVSKGAVESAKKLIDRFMLYPDVFPTSEGNIQFQVEDKDGNYLEMEILEDDTVEIYIETVNESLEECTVNIGDDFGWKKLKSFVRKFEKAPMMRMVCHQAIFTQTKNYFEQSPLTIQTCLTNTIKSPQPFLKTAQGYR